MVARWFIVIAVVTTVGVRRPERAAAATVTATTTPYPGIVHQEWTESSIPARLHVVRVDLSPAEITLEATTEADRGATVSQFAADAEVDVAINGDLFAPVGFLPAGLAIGGSDAWSISEDSELEGFVRFDRAGGTNHVVVSPPEDLVQAGDLPAGTVGVVGGRPLLVRSGAAVASFDCGDLLALACERAPRTAVAVSADGNTMWLVVVDGWQAGSAGMTGAELAGFLEDLGAADALALDGGAASTMVIAAEGGVVSAPSDGVERLVANHLGVRHGALPPGQLIGFVRARDVFDDTANLEGALVTLDDGSTDVVGADGLYNFPEVAPRYACARAGALAHRRRRPGPDRAARR